MIAAAAMVLTACGTEVPDLSKLDNDKAAEYMAGAVLKYDSDYAYTFNYDRAVLDPTPVPTAEPTVEPKQTETPSSQTAGDVQGGEEVQQTSLTDVFGISNVTIEYVSNRTKESYGKGYESIVASNGKKLLIVYFNIKNTAGDSQLIDLIKNKPDYVLQQEDRRISPLHTAAQGDLQFFKTKIASGKSEQGILMFEVDEDMKLAGTSLLITNGTKQATITLQ